MRTAPWTALSGALMALAGVLGLPWITVPAAGAAVSGVDTWTGVAALALAATAAGAALLTWRHRWRPGGWLLAALAVGLGALAVATWTAVWELVPCASLGLGLCDAATGGLIEGTPVTLGAGVAAVAAAGAVLLLSALGIVLAPDPDARLLRLTLAWGGDVLAEHVVRRAAPVSVGEARDATVQVAAAGLHRHTLLIPQGRWRWRLELPRGVGGRIQRSGEAQAVEAGEPVDLGPGDTGQVTFDHGLVLGLSFVAPPAERLGTLFQIRDSRLAVSFAAVAALMLLLSVSMLRHGGQRPAGVQDGLEDRQEPDIPIAWLEPQEPEPPPIVEESPALEPTGKRAGGEEGRAGEPDQPPDKRTRTPKRDGRLAERVDVRQVGVVAALNQGGGAIRQILDGGTEPMATRMAQVASAGEGAELEFGHGTDGIGFRDTGRGGGGDGAGRIHGRGRIDVGGGLGRDAGVGIGRRKPRAVPPVSPEPAQASGGCDRNDIRKQVRGRAAAIRACYETRLMSTPDLQGKMTAQWTIRADGTVGGEKLVQDTVDDSKVSDCVLRAVRRMRFQAPEAGICVIQWPFVFQMGR